MNQTPTGLGVLTHLRDRRPTQKVIDDFRLGIKRERQVMHGLMKFFPNFDRSDVWYEQIDKTEDGTINMAGHFDSKPDYWFHFFKSVTTYEIKVSNTGRWHQNNVYIKIPAVLAMTRNPAEYPNGQVLVVTNKKFAKMDAQTVAKYPIITPQFYGGYKKVFAVPVEHFEWRSWIAPIF